MHTTRLIPLPRPIIHLISQDMTAAASKMDLVIGHVVCILYGFTKNSVVLLDRSEKINGLDSHEPACDSPTDLLQAIDGVLLPGCGVCPCWQQSSCSLWLVPRVCSMLLRLDAIGRYYLDEGVAFVAADAVARHEIREWLQFRII